MNGESYRNTSKSSDRRVINRSGSVQASTTGGNSGNSFDERVRDSRDEFSLSRQSEPPLSGGRSKSQKQPKGRWWITIVIVVLTIVAVSGWTLWFVQRPSGAETGIDSSRYQAVFLANGQVYFGKMSDVNDTSFKMTTTYYPQTKAEDTNADGLQLIRLGDEVHGPDNTMYITKKQILYYENLKSDSKVSQLIKQNEATHK